MLLTISLLGLSVSLVSWQLWKEWDKSYLLGIASFTSIVLASFSLIFWGGFSIKKLGIFAASLLSIAVFSFIASGLRQIHILKVPYLILITFATYNIMMSIPGGVKKANVASIAEDGEFLVKIDPSKSNKFLDYIASKGFKAEPAFQPLVSDETELDDYFLVNIPNNSDSFEKIKSGLLAQTEVLYLENNETIEIPTLTRSKTQRLKESNYLYFDPMNKDQWALSQTKMNDLYKIVKESKPEHRATLYILDTGVDGNHPDLQDVFGKTNKRNDQDKKGHGTHCAGIAGAMTGNGIGISSYNAEGLFEIRSIKVLADFGGGTQEGIIDGMIKAIDGGADVISMSLGGRSSDSRQRAYNEVIEYAERNNVIILAAAGNSNANAKFYCPANSKGILTVAAVDQQLNKAVFSNTLEDIEMGVSAPGVDILSTFPNNKYEKFSGTSMATPYVAGFVTLMKCYQPNLSTEEAFQLLSDTGIQTQDNKIKTVINPSSSLKKLLQK